MKKCILRSILTTAIMTVMFIISGKMDVKAIGLDEVNAYVKAMVEAEGDESDSIYDNTVSYAEDFDYNRYATENPDVAAVFGLNQDALYNHYTTCGAKEGRKAYYTDGTIIAAPGISVSRPEMLDLVNADRAANGAAPLAWSEEMANHCLTRVLEVLANMQSAEYREVKDSNDPYSGIIAHRGHIYQENAMLDWSADTVEFANSCWIGSEGHHEVRTDAEYTQYAAASYLDPVTGQECWIEVFE